MPNAIPVELTEEFDLDVAHYSVPEATVARLRRALAADPSRGAADSDPSGVRRWETDGLRVSYQHFVFGPGQSLLILYRLTPVEEPPPRLAERARDLLRLLGDLKRVFTGW